MEKDLIVSAHAKDGIIEAIEVKGKKFVLGLQWHPEHLENGKLIFKAFADDIKKGSE